MGLCSILCSVYGEFCGTSSIWTNKMLKKRSVYLCASFIHFRRSQYCRCSWWVMPSVRIQLWVEYISLHCMESDHWSVNPNAVSGNWPWVSDKDLVQSYDAMDWTGDFLCTKHMLYHWFVAHLLLSRMHFGLEHAWGSSVVCSCSPNKTAEWDLQR